TPPRTEGVARRTRRGPADREARTSRGETWRRAPGRGLRGPGESDRASGTSPRNDPARAPHARSDTAASPARTARAPCDPRPPSSSARGSVPARATARTARARTARRSPWDGGRLCRCRAWAGAAHRSWLRIHPTRDAAPTPRSGACRRRPTTPTPPASRRTAWRLVTSARGHRRQTVEPTPSRRFPIGAEVFPGHGTHFRVWAPQHRRVYVVERRPHDPEPGRAHPLVAEAGGYHAGWVPSFTEGSLYSFRLGDGSALYPDPAAKFQPEGPHGPSQVVDHGRYHWKHGDFAGASREGSHVLYEMHIGTFTREGTYAAAREQLAELAELGVTILELMPLAEFPGRFGWGYDGV